MVGACEANIQVRSELRRGSRRQGGIFDLENFWMFKSSSFSNGLIDMCTKQPRAVGRELSFDRPSDILF
jgi:hypothetical protein